MANEAPLILLVDDDEDFRTINRLLLTQAGYRVVCAADPDEGLQRMTSTPADLVITDLMMTNLDSGFSFALRLKQDPRFRHVPVIIATAVSSQAGLDFRPRTPTDLAAMGADAYFDKPIQSPALLAKVAELLLRR